MDLSNSEDRLQIGRYVPQLLALDAPFQSCEKRCRDRTVGNFWDPASYDSFACMTCKFMNKSCHPIHHSVANELGKQKIMLRYE